MLSQKELQQFNRTLGDKKYDRLPIIFSALSEPNRCRIVRLLIEKGEDSISVADISQVAGISQSLTSQHLKLLLVTEIVRKERSGRNIFYHLNTDDPIVTALTKAVLTP